MVSILNRDITTSTQRGICICYLFKKDISGFYLTLNQSVTHFENLFGSDKFTNARKVCDYFKSQIYETTFSKNDIHLGATSQYPKFYRVNGKLEDNFILDPITFMARYKYPEVKVK